MTSRSVFLFCFIFAGILIKTDLSHCQQDMHILVKGNSVLILSDTTIVVRNDSAVTLLPNTPYKIMDVSAFKSSVYYDSLRNQKNHGKIKSTLYKYLLTKPSSVLEKRDFQKSEESFLSYEGMIIDRIRLKSVRLLSGSIYDTLTVEETAFSSLLNSLHFQTRNRVIRNNLLFKVGEKIDPYQLADNERILRNLPYIEDAIILVRPLEDEQKVEVIVITKDLFSVGFAPTIIDAKRYRVAVFDRNLFGLGTELRYQINYNANEKPPTAQEIKYSLTNIKGTFISGLLSYKNTFDGIFSQLLFEKLFLTPQTRYAGAVELGSVNSQRDEIWNDQYVEVPYLFHYQDLWLGRSFLIRHDHSRKNLIFSARFRNDNFQKRPEVNAESDNFYHNKQLSLASISFTQVYYYKSSMILSFGVTEDIPVGYRMQLTGGFNNEEFAKENYLGLTFGGSKLWTDIGFLGGGVQYGTFIRNGKATEGTLKISGSYFTPLSKLNSYRFRQLVSMEYLQGIDRLPGQQIDLSGWVRGLPGQKVVGTSRFTFNLESVFFTPWNVWGFKFALYGFGDLGVISQNSRLLDIDNMYSSVGIGCRIRNESLVFRTLQIRIGYLFRSIDNSRNWAVIVNSRESSFFDPVGFNKPEIISFK